MHVETLPVGLLGCNCSILVDAESQRAVVIDPGGEGQTILGRLRALGATLQAILLTHAHIDHVAGIPELCRELEVPVRLHPADRFLCDLLPEQAGLLGAKPPILPPLDPSLEDGMLLEFGSLRLRVLHTPGHSPGSVGFLLEQEAELTLFAGDTLFRGGVGRTDLWGGDTRALMASLRDPLLGLADPTVVVPGHGASTTIGEERAHNPFLVGLGTPR
jgi:glyoxylase-like metal-dependent hydrolase (beta-lactamase superfamily II)